MLAGLLILVGFFTVTLALAIYDLFKGDRRSAKINFVTAAFFLAIIVALLLMNYHRC